MKLHLPKLLRLALMPSLLSVTLLSAWAEDEMIQSEDMNSEYGVELALADSDYTMVNGKKVLNIGMGSGTMYTGEDLIVGNLVNSDGEVVTRGDCDMVGAVENGVFVDYDTINNDAKNKYTNNLKIGTKGFLGLWAESCDLTIYGEGRVVLGGQNGSNYQTLTANKVIVDGNEGVTNLQASNAHLNTLEIHGGRVELHAGGNFRSGNDVSGGSGKRTEISNKIIMKGGSLLLGSEGTVTGEVTKDNGEVQKHYLTKLSGSIEQSGNSSIKVAGWSLATAGLKIVQAEGALEFRDRLDITGSKKTISIWQGYEYDASGNLQEVVNPAITTAGEPVVSKITFGDLGKGTYEINQANKGTIQINKVQSGASLNINQTGTGSIVLGSGFDADAVTVSKSTGTLEFKGNVKLGSLTKDGGAIKVAAGSTMETGSLSWNLEEKQTKDASADLEISGNVSLSGGSISSADKKVTITGTLAADNITVSNGSTLENSVNSVISVGDSLVLTNGSKLVNNGTITGSTSAYALMTADEQAAELLSGVEGLIVLEDGSEVLNAGIIDADVLVQGGILTLGQGGITQDIIMESGSILVTGNGVETGSLTLSGGTITFADGATVALKDDVTYDLSGVEIVVMVDNVDNVVGNVFSLFEGAGDGTVTGWDGATVKFQDANDLENVVAGTITAVGNGSFTVNATVSVPEPTTATLSLLALAGLCARRRRS